jgi:molybdopterin-guanine dinucleotide biosynthesis protein A
MKPTAVILAGGASRRMGRDKASLTIEGRTLLDRQVSLARQLGVHEVLVSAGSGQRPVPDGCRIVSDRVADKGPLAGIASALAASASPLLLVLAVDMPGMSVACLQKILAWCRPGRGAVPTIGGRPEPLAAVYPRETLQIAGEMLAAGEDPVVSRFCSRSAQAGWVTLHDMDAADETCFANWNRPADVRALPPIPCEESAAHG